jgi:hypothetical protein
MIVSVGRLLVLSEQEGKEEEEEKEEEMDEEEEEEEEMEEEEIRRQSSARSQQPPCQIPLIQYLEQRNVWLETQVNLLEIQPLSAELVGPLGCDGGHVRHDVVA